MVGEMTPRIVGISAQETVLFWFNTQHKNIYTVRSKVLGLIFLKIEDT
jgi:hypothetical protein